MGLVFNIRVNLLKCPTRSVTDIIRYNRSLYTVLKIYGCSDDRIPL